MSHVHSGPLATYNSLKDPSLANYFNKPKIYRQLRKSGLVSKKGEIISESTYRINMARSEHQRHVKDMLAQAIVHKTLDMERTRQVAIKKKLEEISKIELVRKVRNDRSHYGDEDVLPYLSPRPKSSRSRSRPSSVPAGKSRRGRRPMSAPSRKRPMSGKTGQHETEEMIYLDEDGMPISPRSASPGSPQQGRRGRRTKKAPYPKDQIDDKHLYSLNRQSLQEYTNSQQMDDSGGASPYNLPQIGLHEPAPPKKKGGHRRGRRTVQPTDSHGRPIKSKRFTNKVSTSASASDTQGTLMLHRSEPAMKHQERVQTLCDVTMHYFGSNIQLDYEKFDPRDEITVEQQHCGGNTLIVFREKIEPRSDFTFVSRRHRGYPFSLTFYINGVLDCRLSVCCEYKHKPGSRLTGKLGHFGVVGVEGAAPCYRCQISEEMKQKSTRKPKSSRSTDYDNDFEEEEEDEEEQDGQSTARSKDSVHVKGEGDDTTRDNDEHLSGDEEQLPWKRGKVPESETDESESDSFPGENEILSETQSVYKASSIPESRSSRSKSRSGSRSTRSGSGSSASNSRSSSSSSSGSGSESGSSSPGDSQSSKHSHSPTSRSSVGDDGKSTGSSQSESHSGSNSTLGSKHSVSPSEDKPEELKLEEREDVVDEADDPEKPEAVVNDEQELEKTSKKYSEDESSSKKDTARSSSSSTSESSSASSTSSESESESEEETDEDDKKEEEKSTHRESEVDDKEQDTHKEPGATYKVTVKTTDKIGSGTDANVYIILFGDDTDSGVLHLKDSNLHENPFEAGHTDIFTFPDISLGAPHKVRVWHDNKGQYNAWHLEEIVVENTSTNVKYTFPCNRWLSDSDDDKEISRDLTCDAAGNIPVSKPVGTTYRIAVKTTDKTGAGTDANVYIILYGPEYDSGELHLKTSDLHKDPFEYGHTDMFTFSELSSLGPIQKVKIWHDNKGSFNSWHLDQVEVEDIATNTTYTFPCNRWLSDSEDDNQICRELVCSNLPTSSGTGVETTYRIAVKTTDKTGAGTDANVFIILYGPEYDSGELHLKTSDSHKDPFESGHTDMFTFPDMASMGPIQKVKIWHDNKGSFNSWHLDQVEVYDVATNTTYTFPCDRWLSDSDDDEQTCRELVCSNLQSSSGTELRKEENEKYHNAPVKDDENGNLETARSEQESNLDQQGMSIQGEATEDTRNNEHPEPVIDNTEPTVAASSEPQNKEIKESDSDSKSSTGKSSSDSESESEKEAVTEKETEVHVEAALQAAPIQNQEDSENVTSRSNAESEKDQEEAMRESQEEGEEEEGEEEEEEGMGEPKTEEMIQAAEAIGNMAEPPSDTPRSGVSDTSRSNVNEQEATDPEPEPEPEPESTLDNSDQEHADGVTKENTASDGSAKEASGGNTDEEQSNMDNTIKTSEESANSTLQEMEDEMQKVLEREKAQDSTSPESNAENASNETTEESDSSGSEDGEADEKNDVQAEEQEPESARDTPRFHDMSTADETETEAPTATEDEDQAGGNDPDNVANPSDETPRATQLSVIGVTPGEKIEGHIRDKVQGRKDVELTSIALSKTQVEELAEVLKENRRVETLVLRNSNLDDQSLETLARALEETETDDLKMLNLNCNTIGPEGAKHVVSILCHKPELEILLLHGLKLEDKGVQTFVEGLSDIHFSGANTSPEKMAAIKEAAKEIVSGVLTDALQSSSLESVAASEGSGGSQNSHISGLLALLDEQEEEVQSGLHLKQLDLGDCMMTNTGAMELAKLIALKTPITTLNLTGNKDVKIDGWRYIAEALKVNKSTTTLSLDYNNLGDAGAMVIADMLRQNTTLNSIDLEGNKIGEDGAREIYEALKSNEKSQVRDITLMPRNNISEDDVMKIKQLLAERSQQIQEQLFET